MKQYKAEYRNIYKDCRKAMMPASLLYLSTRFGNEIVAIYLAGVLGSFADAVLQLNFADGIEGLGNIAGVLVVSILVFPAVGALADVIMVKDSVKHDRLVLARYLDKKYEDIKTIDKGEFQNRIEWDPNSFRINWVSMMEHQLSIPIILAIFFYQTLAISPLYTLVILLVSGMKFLVPIGVRKLQAKYDKETREYEAGIRSLETNLIVNPYLPKMYGIVTPLLQKLNQRYETFVKEVLEKHVKLKIGVQAVQGFLDTFCTLLILIAGALLVSAEMLSVGSIASMIAYFAIFNGIIKSMTQLIEFKQISRNLAERLLMFYQDLEVQEGEEVHQLQELCCQNLSFSYGEQMVVKEQNLKIKAGGKYAIIGKNGSGKSTMLKLISGLIHNYQGNICVNGSALKDMHLDSYRKGLAYAPQEAYLFQGTVKENIWFGNQEAKEEEVDALLETLGMEALSDKEVSMSQNDLSGGEKQKISIARAVLKNTSLLLLDEPSNHLDVESMAWLKKWMEQYQGTLILVSHDRSLLVGMDQFLEVIEM